MAAKIIRSCISVRCCRFTIPCFILFSSIHWNKSSGTGLSASIKAFRSSNMGLNKSNNARRCACAFWIEGHRPSRTAADRKYFGHLFTSWVAAAVSVVNFKAALRYTSCRQRSGPTKMFPETMATIRKMTLKMDRGVQSSQAGNSAFTVWSTSSESRGFSRTIGANFS